MSHYTSSPGTAQDWASRVPALERHPASQRRPASERRPALERRPVSELRPASPAGLSAAYGHCSMPNRAEIRDQGPGLMDFRVQGRELSRSYRRFYRGVLPLLQVSEIPTQRRPKRIVTVRESSMFLKISVNRHLALFTLFWRLSLLKYGICWY